MTKNLIYCPGHLEITGKEILLETRRSWKVSLEKSLRESCDVFYYDIALKVGIKKIAEVARRFGFDEKHDISMSVENEGLIAVQSMEAADAQQQWLIGDTANVAIGQGDILAYPFNWQL